jgi:hypothetical protein
MRSDGENPREWDVVAQWFIVALAVVAVIVGMTFVIGQSVQRHNTQMYDLAKTCVDSGGQWIQNMCVRGGK